jgi:hypothetical protein
MPWGAAAVPGAKDRAGWGDALFHQLLLELEDRDSTTVVMTLRELASALGSAIRRCRESSTRRGYRRPFPSPEEDSDGTSPTNAMNSSAILKRSKSPISLTSASAVSVSTPRRHVVCELAPRALLGRLADRALERLDPRDDQVDGVHIRIDPELLRRELDEHLRRTAVQEFVGGVRSVRRQNFDKRWRSRIRSGRASSRARNQITRGLQLPRRHMDRLHRSASEQLGELYAHHGRRCDP